MSAPAPAWRRVLAQSVFEARTMLTNGEQVLLALVIPTVALFALVTVDAIDLGTGAGPRVDAVAPGVIALAILASSFTSRAILTAFDRRAGVLRLLATTPLGPGGLLGGAVGAVLLVLVFQITVLASIACVGFGWRPDLAGLPVAALAVALAALAFTGLALLLAGALRAEAVLGLSNLLFLALAAGGGILVAPAAMPAPLAWLAQLLPSGALGEALRASLGGGPFPVVPLVVLAAWSLALTFAVRRWFRWM